ncbi:hypothetical protein B0H11DRAFT_1908459 [Mycena galericulata]|nr:hypothetical protein B0H11DRAFT_1908459 [Mycena galericulata]
MAVDGQWLRGKPSAPQTRSYVVRWRQLAAIVREQSGAEVDSRSNIPAAGKFAGGRRWTPLASGGRWQILFAIVCLGSNSGCRQSPSAFTATDSRRISPYTIGSRRKLTRGPMAPSGSHQSLVSRAANQFHRK